MPSLDFTCENSPRLVVLVGPTAVGKTELSIRLAESLRCEIVSADSRLFYIGMDIGTAKPTLDDRKRVRHHLIDVTTPDSAWSLAVFQAAAHNAIMDINRRGLIPLLVGGTGQYVRAVREGWQVPGVQPDPALRQALQHMADQIGAERLHQKLALIDPEAAAGIDFRNVRRTIRAFEVIFTTGKRYSSQRLRQPSPYQVLVLGLTRPRSELYERVDSRIQEMIKQGFLNEVRRLLAMGNAPDLPAFSAIGYREMIAHLQGKISLEEAILNIKRQSRIFVRRQANWFKLEDPNIHWFQAGQDTIPCMLELIRDWQTKYI